MRIIKKKGLVVLTACILLVLFAMSAGCTSSPGSDALPASDGTKYTSQTGNPSNINTGAMPDPAMINGDRSQPNSTSHNETRPYKPSMNGTAPSGNPPPDFPSNDTIQNGLPMRPSGNQQ